MAKSILQKHYLRILTHWPTDLLRPEVSFQTAMRRRIDARLAPTTTTTTTTPPEANIVSNGAQVSIPTAVAFDEKGELEQVNVLYSFLEDRYAKRVCTRCLLHSLIFVGYCGYYHYYYYVRVCAPVYTHIYIYIHIHIPRGGEGGKDSGQTNEPIWLTTSPIHPGGRKIAVSAVGEDDPAGLEAGLLRRLAQGAGRGAAAVLVPERGE